MLRADGTVLARYGSRSSDGAMSSNSMEGLKTTLERVLDVHQNWPANQTMYADKRGPLPRYTHVEDIPSTTIKEIVGNTDSQRGCVHCHNVYDALRDVDISRGTYDPRFRWKYPLPQNLGLTFQRHSGPTVQTVASPSPAEDAGARVYIASATMCSSWKSL